MQPAHADNLKNAPLFGGGADAGFYHSPAGILLLPLFAKQNPPPMHKRICAGDGFYWVKRKMSLWKKSAGHLFCQLLGNQDQHNGGHRQNGGTDEAQGVLAGGVVEIGADLGAYKGADTVADED